MLEIMWVIGSTKLPTAITMRVTGYESLRQSNTVFVKKREVT